MVLGALAFGKIWGPRVTDNGLDVFFIVNFVALTPLLNLPTLPFGPGVPLRVDSFGQQCLGTFDQCTKMFLRSYL